MISLLFGIGYAELCWLDVKRGRRPASYAKTFVGLMGIFNYCISILVGSVVNLEISIIFALYVIVIYNQRISKK